MDETRKLRSDEVLASYGADPARWPAADRTLLSGSAATGATAAAEIDRVLDRASHPALPAGFEARLMAKLAPSAPTNVVAFQPRQRRKPRAALPWLTALPLAASLALGIYLGAAGTFDAVLPAAVTGDMAASDDDGADPSGVGIATDYSADDVS